VCEREREAETEWEREWEREREVDAHLIAYSGLVYEQLKAIQVNLFVSRNLAAIFFTQRALMILVRCNCAVIVVARFCKNNTCPRIKVS
jgi:hypothetical protein